MRLPKTLPSKLLTPAVESLIEQFLSLVRDYPLRRRPVELEKIVRLNPAVNAAAQIRTVLLPLLMMGDYSHPDEKIQDFVRAELAAMAGSWRSHVAKITAGKSNYGFAVAEKEYKVTLAGCGLSRLRVLNQQFTNFEGSVGDIKNVVYSPPRLLTFGGKTKDRVTLPIESVIHLVNEEELILGYDPKGSGILDRVAPYHDAFNLMMGALTLASKRQATPILVGKTKTAAQKMSYDDAGQPVIDPATGNPQLINAGEKFKSDLEQAENGSVLVIDLQDELNAIVQKADGELILEGLQFILMMIMMCYLVPITSIGMSTTGVGDSGLSQHHQKMLLMNVKSDVLAVGETLCENWLRPCLEWNFGELDTYGSFPIIEAKDSAETIALLNVIPSILGTGTISAEDEMLIAKIRDSLGI